MELECYMPADLAFEQGGYHAGRQMESMPAGWNCQSDGSISTSAPAGYRGQELVSPILQGEEGLLQVVGLADYLSEIGAKTGPACGIHVHVDATDLTPEQVAAVEAGYRALERALYSLNGARAAARWRNGYCWPLEMGTTPHGHPRYQGLNLSNLTPASRKKTVEFRLWAHSTDALFLITAIQASMAVVEAALAGDLASLQPGQPIEQQLDALAAAMATYRVADGEDDSLEEIRADLGERARRARLP